MDSRRTTSARRWTAVASVVLVAGAVLVAVIASGAAQAQTQAVPSNTSPPTISGTAAVGQTLTASPGTWTGSPTSYSYHWFRCGGSCAAITGATASSYTVSSADVGSRLMVAVMATNAEGSSPTATSAQTSIVSAVGPVATSEPVISGSAVQGQTLTTTTGGWTSSSPITYAFHWVRCGTDGGAPDGSNCSSIVGATGQTYKLAAADVGHRLRAQVRATNSTGSSIATSNPTAVVQAAFGAPRNTREPTISGSAKQGQTLTATNGSWSSSAPITYAYHWFRCGADGGAANASNCPPIPGATGKSYKLAAADVGHRPRVQVRATNSAGSSVATSNPTAVVQPSGPVLPPGAIKLPNGKYSIPASSVSLPARLVIDGISFQPNPVRTRNTTIQLRVHVSDTRGYYVRDVLVFARSTPLQTTPAGEPRTGQDGWVTITTRPKANFPLRNGWNVQFFVRARKQGDNVLAGVSTRRLVQVRTARG